MVFKLRLLVLKEDSDDVYIWEDFWLDVTAIIGFRMNRIKFTSDYEAGISVYTSGEYFLVKSEPHIEKYLLKKFVEDAIEQGNGVI